MKKCLYMLLVLFLLTGCAGRPEELPTPSPLRHAANKAEVEAVIREYRSSLGEAAIHLRPKPASAADLDPKIGALPGGPDPYVLHWRVRPEPGGFVVSVRRDRDVDRASALLAEFDNVRAERGEDPADAPSPVTEENLGSRGELRAELIPQTDPRLYRESLWALTFRLDGEETQRFSDQRLFPEYRSEDGWRVLPGHNRTALADWLVSEMPHLVLKPGDNLFECNLGEFSAEFDPGKEYRFVLSFSSLEGGGVEYYTCPFSITLEGEA